MIDKQQLNLLYRYCYALTVQRDDAYDLLQASLEKFLRKPASNNQSKMAYLRKIIRNQFIDNSRRSKCVEFESLVDHQDVVADVIEINAQSLENMLINEEHVDLVWSVLNTSEREIIFLWAIEGYTAAEIAIEVEIPRGTVLSKIHRMRKKISVQLYRDEAGNVLKEPLIKSGGIS